jgi:GNAT superfamily N-acetyltransferase
MKIRLSTFEDVSRIMEIINDAKALLKSLNIDQWQNGYPNAEQVENDILNEESYVVVNDDKKIMATSMFTLRKEPTYKIIDGNWIVDEHLSYGVIHRLAMSKDYRGLGIAKFIFKEFHQQLKDEKIQSLKIDTHDKNVGMQSLIKKLGYQYCGIIYTNYNAKRLAFEKVFS